MVDQRTYISSHTRAIPSVDQITFSTTSKRDLKTHLQFFLFDCRVDSYSQFTINGYSDKIGQFVNYLASMGITKPSEVNSDYVQLFLLKKKEKGCNRTTISNFYRANHRFFNWLVEKQILQESPMVTMKSPKTSEPIIVPFSIEQIHRLLFMCDERKFLGARNRAIILVFVDTGLRLSELASIQLDDIDFAHEIIKVMGKGMKERVVRIGKAAQKAVLHYWHMRDDDLPCLWVTEERRPLTFWGIEIMIRRLGKRAGLTNVRCSPHTFRHTFATSSLENGAAEWEVQSLLGHKTLTMTRRYTNTLRSQKAAIGHRRFSPVDNMKLR